MKKLFGILGSIAVFIVLILAMVFGKMIGRGVADVALEPNRGELLSQAANQINAKLPMMVDSETRLDSTQPGQDNSFDYIYTLVNYPSTALEPNAVANLAPKIINHSCSLPQMQKFLSLGVTAVYIYRGNDGVEVGRVQVHQRDCLAQQPSSLQQTIQPVQPSPQMTSQSRSIGTSASQAGNTTDYQNTRVSAASRSGPNYDSPHNRHCLDHYNQQTSRISNSVAIGEYVNIRDRYERELNTCLR